MDILALLPETTPRLKESLEGVVVMEYVTCIEYNGTILPLEVREVSAKSIFTVPCDISYRLIHPFNYKFSDYFRMQMSRFNIKNSLCYMWLEDNSLKVGRVSVVFVLSPKT